MRIHKSQYKIFTDHILYEPVAGLTIKQAFEDAIQISAFEGLPVHININDIILTVHRNSRLGVLIAKYHFELEKRGNNRKVILMQNQKNR